MANPNRLSCILRSLRLPFVVLTPACVVVGLGTAVQSGTPINWFHFTLVMVGAIAAHLSVNTFNEYSDFKSGLDFRTTRTPFSGGSGALPDRPDVAPAVLAAAWAALGVTAAMGLFFAVVRGWAVLPLVLAGLVLIATYTVWITRVPWLCLVAPGLGFGPLMVVGTHFALTGGYTWSAVVASLVPFFLVNNILLLNQFPDVEPDRSSGRRHFPVLAGRRASSVIFVVMLALAYVAVGVGVLTRLLPRASLLGLLTLPIALPLGVGAWRWADNTRALLPYLRLNVLVAILTPSLLAAGLLVR